MPVFGTCAGAIILSKGYLDLMDIEVDRNAYGSQLQSFAAEITISDMGTVRAEFIRAPKITSAGPDVTILAEHGGSPVFVRHGNRFASTFHTETMEDARLHAYIFQR